MCCFILALTHYRQNILALVFGLANDDQQCMCTSEEDWSLLAHCLFWFSLCSFWCICPAMRNFPKPFILCTTVSRFIFIHFLLTNWIYDCSSIGFLDLPNKLKRWRMCCVEIDAGLNQRVHQKRKTNRKIGSIHSTVPIMCGMGIHKISVNFEKGKTKLKWFWRRQKSKGKPDAAFLSHFEWFGVRFVAYLLPFFFSLISFSFFSGHSFSDDDVQICSVVCLSECNAIECHASIYAMESDHDFIFTRHVPL